MMISFRNFTALIVILSMAFSNLACTTMKSIPWTESTHIASQIKPGDKIKYRTVDGEISQLKVTSVNDEMIKGTNRGLDKTVMIADLTSIEKIEINAGKTTLLVLGIVAGVAIVLAIAAIAAASSMDYSDWESY